MGSDLGEIASGKGVGAVTYNQPDVPESNDWLYAVAVGIALIVAGVAAVAFPLFSTIAMKVLLGWILLLCGVSEVLNAFVTVRWRGFIWHFLVGVLFLIAGGWLAFFPLAGITTLTILLAIVFIVEGVVEVTAGIQARPKTGWGLMIVSGLVALAVGILIALELPSSAGWAIGVLAGLNLIVSGIANFVLGLLIRGETASAS